MADEDGDRQKGPGEGGKDDDKGKKDENQELLGKLAEGLNILAHEMEGVKTRLDNPPKKDDKEGDDDDDDDDSQVQDPDERTLESMSRKEFANFISSKFEKAVGKQLKTIQDAVGHTNRTVSEDRIRAQVNDIVSKPENADFFDWSEEIKAVAKENPGISVKRAYTLAKAENPEKAAKLKEKYSKERGDKENNPGEKGKGKGKSSFGGLTPSSGVEVPNPKMDRKTAAEKAWDQVMGSQQGFGGE